MIWLIFLLLILPFLIGMTFRSKATVYLDTTGMLYVFGFLFLFVLYGVFYYPFYFLHLPLHILSLSFFFTCTVLTVLCLCILIRRKSWKEWKNPLGYLKTEDRIALIIWILAILFIAFQLFRVVALQPYEYRDDKTYIALVNDMVSRDTIYGTEQESGALLPKHNDTVKYMLSAWMPFEATCSQISGLHPLITCRTLLPGVLLICYYAIMDNLGKWLFHTDEKGRSLFLLVIAILNQTCSRYLDQALILMHWPAWGKGVVSLIVVPLLLVFMLKLGMEQRKRMGILMVGVVLASGAFASPMGLLIPPIEIVILSIVLIVRKKTRREGHEDASDGI